MFVVALLALSRQGLLTARGGVDRSRALYAAEAGLARAIAEMERDPSWRAGFVDERLPGGTGSFSAAFASDPSASTREDCLNNLQGTTAVDSYHGHLSLPAHSALLVVTGRSGSATRTVEALVVTGLDVSVSDALTATGPIRLGGSVAVDGRKSLVDASARPANLHHNSEDTGQVGVLYNGGASPWEQITVTGEVTSSSSDPSHDVIVFNTPHSVPEARSGVPIKELPRPNIEAMLAEHSGLAGTPIPSAPGAWSLSGDNYYDGDVTINGDLDLQNGARVFVRGNLTINGSVRGDGTLVVGGTSEFFGDSAVSARQSDYVALLSRGSVTLKGFEGETYIRSLTASNPEAAQRWDDLRYGLDGISRSLGNLGGESPEVFHQNLSGNDRQIDYYQAFVGHHPFGRIYGEAARLGPVLVDGRPRSYSNARYFVDLLDGPPLSTERFLGERFQNLDDWFRQAHLGRDGNQAARYAGGDLFDHYQDWNPDVDGGMFDSLQSVRQQSVTDEVTGVVLPAFSFTDARKEIFADGMAAVQAFDYNRVGNANFKGLIYTSGAFVGRDDVTVLGTVIVNGDPQVAPLVYQGVTYQPGQVGLFGYSRLTRVDEFFDDGVHQLMGAGALDVKRWVCH